MRTRVRSARIAGKFARIARNCVRTSRLATGRKQERTREKSCPIAKTCARIAGTDGATFATLGRTRKSSPSRASANETPAAGDLAAGVLCIPYRAGVNAGGVSVFR